MDINSIINNIAQQILSEKDSDKNGLFDGEGGKILFMAYYLKYKPQKEYEEKLNHLIDGCFEYLNKTKSPYPSYCVGLSGIIYLFEHLNRQKLVDMDIEEAKKYYDPYLYHHMMYSVGKNNFDFLHGATGMAYDFLCRNGKDDNIILYLNNYIDALDRFAVKEDDTIRWPYTDIKGSEIYSYSNLSLSHGMASIMIVLALLIKNGINLEKSKELLTGAVNYALGQKMNPSERGSYFSSFSLHHSTFKSRLSWCYGDLGIALALWYASKIFDDNHLEEEALDIFRFNAHRRDLKENNINDTSICHGSAGVSQFFLRMYYETHEPVFWEAHNYWIDITLSMMTTDNSKVVFPSYKWDSEKDEFKVLKTNQYFLEGLSGIGLALLAHVAQDTFHSEWDSILLLNNN